MIKVRTEELTNAILIRISGRAGITEPPVFQINFSPAFEEQFDKGHRAFVIDLSDFELQDSGVIGDILRAAKQLKAAEGSMVCVQNPKMIRLWKQFKLDEAVPCYESVEQAAEAIGKR